MKEWQDDRAAALKLKYESSRQDSDTLYENDDKCGSHWQCLPVNPTGRETKAGAKNQFEFSIQANVVFGEGGVQMFSVTPKTVPTGGNFGLTNFVMVLWRAKQLGRLNPHVTRLVRHTDGGPDNVALVTHLLHWLLVHYKTTDSVRGSDRGFTFGRTSGSLCLGWKSTRGPPEARVDLG